MCLYGASISGHDCQVEFSAGSETRMTVFPAVFLRLHPVRQSGEQTQYLAGIQAKSNVPRNGDQPKLTAAEISEREAGE